MKNLFSIFILIFIIHFLISCGETTPVVPVKTPSITAIVPDSGRIGDTITITGTNFGSDRGTSVIYFNAVQAVNYINWNDKSINVQVPVGATTGMVSVVVNNQKSNDVNFRIITQYIPKSDTIIIGSQVWLVRPLDVDHYQNGDSIPEIRDTAGANTKSAAWCYYNNDSANGKIYGKLYNWYAVTDHRGLAPKGWHIPTYSEWNLLVKNLGGDSVAGGKMKEAGTAHWNIPNTGATNSSGFTALPGGYHSFDLNFYDIKNYGMWWTSTEYLPSGGWYISMSFQNPYIMYNHIDKSSGLSIILIRD